MPTQRVQLPAFSMFTKTAIYQLTDPIAGNVVVFGLLQDTVVADPSDTIYTVPIGMQGRMDKVSQKFYGVPDLWWVIARANTLLDPLIGPTQGEQLRIPTKTRLASLGVLNV